MAAEVVNLQESEEAQTDAAASWSSPSTEPASASPATLRRWRAATEQVRATAGRLGLSKAEVSRRSGVPQGTFSPWYDGKYPGDLVAVTQRIEKWLAQLAETEALAASLPLGPGFVETKSARKIMRALLYAQTMPSMATVIAAAGCGKTTSARRYVDTRPHAHLVTMRPTTGSVHGMLLAIADSLGVVERNPARLDAAIGDRLRRNGRNTLLAIDEAQHLRDQAVNELRYLLDCYGCGIALLGNEELYPRFGGDRPTAAYAQIHRRVGVRVRVEHPDPKDIAALIDAWDVTDPAARQLATAIGQKPGALSQIAQTLTLAGQIAAGAGRQTLAEDIRAAWMNRGGGAL